MKVLFITKIPKQACLLGKEISSDVFSKIINILLNELFQNLGQLNTKKSLKSEIQINGLYWQFHSNFFSILLFSFRPWKEQLWMAAKAYEKMASLLVLDDVKYCFLNYCTLNHPRSKYQKSEDITACQNKVLNLESVNFRCQMWDGLQDKWSTVCSTTNLMKRRVKFTFYIANTKKINCLLLAHHSVLLLPLRHNEKWCLLPLWLLGKE